jgi:exoribonuclease-2
VVREPERWSRIVELAGRYGESLPSAPDSLSLAEFLARRRAADPDRFQISQYRSSSSWDRASTRSICRAKDPGGHFGLAAHDYTHATAPNRRYADLVTQRLVKAALSNTPAPYSDDELAAVAKQCTEREDAENKVERNVRKIVAALLLSDRIGETFDAIVTGASQKGTFVRTIHPPAEGMVVRGREGFDVGDKVRVKLVAADPQKAFIDFEGRGERGH